MAADTDSVLVGVDEVGRGCLAGPVVAAAVVLPRGARLAGLDDSKRLAPPERERQALRVRSIALAIGFSFVGPRRIECDDIRRASLLAMRRAVRRALVRLGRAEAGAPGRVLVLVDGLDVVPGIALPQRAIVGGDGTSLAIAAASVVAKTVRDAFMTRLATDWPAYGFAQHKGYGTPEHLAALRHAGPCSWHRRTFAPIAQPEFAFDLEA